MADSMGLCSEHLNLGSTPVVDFIAFLLLSSQRFEPPNQANGCNVYPARPGCFIPCINGQDDLETLKLLKEIHIPNTKEMQQ